MSLSQSSLGGRRDGPESSLRVTTGHGRWHPYLCCPFSSVERCLHSFLLKENPWNSCSMGSLEPAALWGPIFQAVWKHLRGKIQYPVANSNSPLLLTPKLRALSFDFWGGRCQTFPSSLYQLISHGLNGACAVVHPFIHPKHLNCFYHWIFVTRSFGHMVDEYLNPVLQSLKSKSRYV